MLFDGVFAKEYNGVAQLVMTKASRVLVGLSTKQMTGFKKQCLKYIKDEDKDW